MKPRHQINNANVVISSKRNGSTCLTRLPLGGVGEVTGIQAGGQQRRRLMDLGLVPGTTVEAVRRSPVGEPTAFLIRGAVIALRREEAEQIMVMQLYPKGGSGKWD